MAQSYTPDESWGEPEEPTAQSFMPDESWGEAQEVEPESAVGSAARGFAHEVLPAAVGGVVGLGAGALTAPFLGGIPGGLAAGAAAGYATRKFEDWLLEKLGFDDTAQQEANRAEHPIATAAGELSTALVPFGVGSKLAAGQRLLGAGIQAGVETGSELAQGQGLDPVQIALAGGVGAIANQPRSGTIAAASRIPGVASRVQPKPQQQPQQQPAQQPQQSQPAQQPQQQALPEGGRTDITNVQHDMQTVMEQIKLYGDDPVLGPYWRQYKEHLEQAPDKGNAGIAQEASQGTGEPFTPKHADAANDVTTVAKGIAAENPPPPSNPATGQPAGQAAGKDTVAARPSSPVRDYRKNKPTMDRTQLSDQVQPGEKVSTGNIAPDIAAVMKNATPQTTFEQQTVKPPAAPQAQTQVPDKRGVQQTVRQAMQVAMRRPIKVVDALPEGANAPFDPKGPVIVHKDIDPRFHRFIAVHETVEAALQAKGMDYDTAHKIATEAEKHAAAKAGFDPKTYESAVDHDAERARSSPPSPPELNQFKHVSTERAFDGEPLPGPKGAVPLEEHPLPVSEGPLPTPDPNGRIPLGNAKKPAVPAGHVALEGPSMEQINQRVASIPGMQTRTNGLSAKSAKPQPIDLIGRGPVTAPVTPKAKPKEAAPARKGLDEHTPEDIAAVLRDNPAAFKKFLDEDPKAVREVLARNKPLLDQVITDHPDLGPILKPMKKAIREKEKYDAGDKRLGKRGEKYEAVRATVKEAVDEAVPHWAAKDDPEGKFDPEHVESIAKRIWENMTKNQPKGFNPFKGEKGYKPQKMYPLDNMHFGVATAAKDVLEAPTRTADPNIQDKEKAIQTFDSWLRAYMDKNEGAAEALQSQRKGAAAEKMDKEVRAPLDEANLENVPADQPREPFPMLEKAKKVLDHNSLREYVNNLSDEDYSRLKVYDDELEKTVLGTRNPSLVQEAYRRYLAPEVEAPKTFQGRRVLEPVERPPPQVAGFDAVSPEETKGVRKAIKTAADLPQGHVPLEAEPEVTAPVTHGPLAREVAPQHMPWYEKGLRGEPRGGNEAEQAAWDRGYLDKSNAERVDPGLTKKFKEFLTDNSGAVRIPAFMQNIGSTWFAPKNTAAKDAAVEFRKNFNVLDGNIQNIMAALHSHMKNIPDISLTEARELMDKAEAKTPFTAAEQALWDKIVKPLEAMHRKELDEARLWNPDIPPHFDDPNAGFVPHMSTKVLETQPISNEPWRRTLNDWAAPLQERTYFAMTAKDGTRHLLEHDDAGDWHKLGPQGGRTQLNVPNGWKGHPGDTLTYGGKTFTVGHAGVDELGKVLKQPPEFVRHPAVAFANSVYGMASANLKHRLFEKINSSPEFIAHSTTDPKEARQKGYVKTKLEEFAERNDKKLYMDKRLAWVLDDFAKPGVEGLEGLSKLSGEFAKALYFVSPAFHPLNVLDLGIHGLGGLWARAGIKGTPGMAQDLAMAWRSVRDQDALQHEMRSAGGRSMYFNTLIHKGFIQTLAEEAGMKLQRPQTKPEKLLGPITDATGGKVDIPGSFRFLMNNSNKITWRSNDVLQTALYLQAKRTGMKPQEAMEFTNKYIGAYRPDNPKFLGSRTLQKFANSPALAWFSNYHQDLVRTYEHLAKGMRDPAGRREAAGAAAAATLMLGVVYPSLLDPLIKKLTGNKDAEFGRRGFSALNEAGYRGFAKGDRDPARLLQNVWTPSIPVNMLKEGTSNRDFTGNPIWQQGMSTGHNLGRTADWALKQALPPYSQAAPAFRPGTNPLTEIPKRLAESSVGIKDPSPQAVKYEHNAPKRLRAAEKRSYKRPGGLFEYLWTHK